jgi:IS30 family transposase
MERKFRSHLTRDERCQIYAHKSSGLSVRKIAKMLDIHPSTVSREFKRNSGGRGYRYKQADELAKERRRNASSVARVVTLKVIQLITEMLKTTYASPVQIAGRLKLEHDISISHETIYRVILEDRLKKGTLYLLLRRKGKKLWRRKPKTSGRGLIPNRRDISTRPAVAGLKEEVGHLEIDTIVGANHKGVILSVVDKATKFTVLELLSAGTAELVTEALIRRISELKASGLTMSTITADNGKEFAKHGEVSQALEVDFFFARPYRSCDRGLNEHTNGLVRQFLPKKTDFTIITHEQVAHIEWILNNRPRKSLNFKTPVEVVNAVLSHGSMSVAFRT